MDNCRGVVTPPLSIMGTLVLFRLQELHVKTKGLELLDENVERLGKTGFQRVLSLDDRFVHAGSAGHVVRLDSQELLKGVGSAVCLHGPDLHFPEPLTPELGLAAEGLLGYQAVGADGAGVDLV